MTMRVLGLDLSYEGCGVAATHSVDGPGLRVRTISAGPRRRGDARLDYVVTEICEELRWEPDLAVIEGLYVGHLNNTLQLAELHGCVKRELFRHDVPYAVVAAATLKVFATGTGRAEKAAVVHMMRARYADALGGPSRIQTNDEADALALAAMGRHAYGQPIAPAPADALRALKSVTWPRLTAFRPGPMPATTPVDPEWDSIAKPDGALI